MIFSIYWPTALCWVMAMIQIPGVLNGSRFSLFSMCFGFTICAVCGIFNGRTHEQKKLHS